MTDFDVNLQLEPLWWGNQRASLLRIGDFSFHGHSSNMTALQAQISDLPPEERLNLIEEIWMSLSVAPEALSVPFEVLDELERRRDRYRSDPDSLQNWEEFRAGVRITGREKD